MVSVMLYPCILCVTLIMDLFVLCGACLTEFVNCLVKQFAICLGVVAILLFYVMKVFTVYSPHTLHHLFSPLILSITCFLLSFSPSLVFSSVVVVDPHLHACLELSIL